MEFRKKSMMPAVIYHLSRIRKPFLPSCKQGLINILAQLSKLFGVYVDKAEHHYETVASVVAAAFTYTHWPTLALAILAFAIMIGLKRINPRIPNVLVAVVVCTLISWTLGFENNRQARLDQIESPQARQLIGQYIRAVDELDAIVEQRVDLSSHLQDVEETQGIHSTDFLELQHRIAVLNLEIGKAKEETRSLRVQLRQLKFTIVQDSVGSLRFYCEGELPPGLKHDGRRWRLRVGYSRLDEDAVTFLGGGAVVGTIPQGLPGLRAPQIDLTMALNLLSMAVIISLLGFMEAISIAKAMAARTGQRLDPNQELIGQGLANIVGSFGQSYAVSGSFSRSAVNIQAGAVTGLSNVFSSGVVILTLLFFTPLLYHLPQAVLAAIIMMAVFGLLNVRGFVHAWKAQKYDGAIGVITFVCTLAFAPHLDRGIIIGVALSLVLHLWRSMKPEIAMLAKNVDGSFRNRVRFDLDRCRHIAVIRYNGSLFFANVNYLEDKVLELRSEMPEIRHVLIVGNGINELDSSGEEMLSLLFTRLRDAGCKVSISGLNDSVLDVLRRTALYDRIGEENLYRSVKEAIDAIWEEAHKGSDEDPCPLVTPPFRALPVAVHARKSVRFDLPDSGKPTDNE